MPPGVSGAGSAVLVANVHVTDQARAEVGHGFGLGVADL